MMSGPIRDAQNEWKEVVMDMDITLSTSEKRLLEVLRERGPQTLDCLCELPDMNWAQVLLSVDHLSRSREVSLELIGRNEYQVSLADARS
jgi:predicted transcriptional regulator